LERLDEDRAIVGFASKAEAKLVGWLDFAKGALLFVMVPKDSEFRKPSTSTDCIKMRVPSISCGEANLLEQIPRQLWPSPSH